MVSASERRVGASIGGRYRCGDGTMPERNEIPGSCAVIRPCRVLRKASAEPRPIELVHPSSSESRKRTRPPGRDHSPLARSRETDPECPCRETATLFSRAFLASMTALLPSSLFFVFARFPPLSELFPRCRHRIASHRVARQGKARQGTVVRSDPIQSARNVSFRWFFLGPTTIRSGCGGGVPPAARARSVTR